MSQKSFLYNSVILISIFSCCHPSIYVVSRKQCDHTFWLERLHLKSEDFGSFDYWKKLAWNNATRDWVEIAPFKGAIFMSQEFGV